VSFLKDRRKSYGGGWAEITDQDIEQLHHIVYQLIEEKCEFDADGHLPIQVILNDRRKCEPLHYQPVPYEHKAITKEGQEELLRVLLANMQISCNKLKFEMDRRRK
jgi:hypothetical protein